MPSKVMRYIAMTLCTAFAGSVTGSQPMANALTASMSGVQVIAPASDNFPGLDTSRYDVGYRDVAFIDGYSTAGDATRAVGVRFTPRAYPCVVRGMYAVIAGVYGTGPQFTSARGNLWVYEGNDSGPQNQLLAMNNVVVAGNKNWKFWLCSPKPVIDSNEFFMFMQQNQGWPASSGNGCLAWLVDNDTSNRLWTFTGSAGFYKATAWCPNLRAVVEYHNVAGTGIAMPRNTSYPYGTEITPVGLFSNRAPGLNDSAVPVHFFIRDSLNNTIYADSQTMVLNDEQTNKPATFATVPLALEPGVYAAVCSTGLTVDIEPQDNAYRHSFSISEATDIAERPTPGLTAELNIFPNPVASKTAVVCRLAQTGRASLKLYSATGKLVGIPAGEGLTAGCHRLLLDVHNLPKGIYLLELRTVGTVLTRKLVVE